MNRTDARGLLGRRAASRVGRLDVSVGEAVIHSGLPARTIHHAIQTGELPVHEVAGKVGREYHIRLDALDRFVSQHTAGAPRAVRPAAHWPGAVIVWPGRRARIRANWLVIGVLAVLVGLVVLGVAAASHVAKKPTSALPTATSVPARATARTGAPTTSLTTGTSFTLIVGRHGGGSVMIRGAVAGDGALTPRMQTLYLGCLVPSSGSSTHHAADVPGATAHSSVNISSTMLLTPSVLQRLQSWAAAYSALLDSGDTRVSNLVDAGQHGKLEQENMSPWKLLREALGPNYIVLDYEANHHSDLRVATHQCAQTPPTARPGSTGPTPSAPTSLGIAGLAAPLSTAQLDLMRWLRTIHDRGAPCADAYGTLLAQLQRILGGAADPAATQNAITQEHRVCHAATVAAVPRSLAGSESAARSTMLALVSVFRQGRAVEVDLPDIAVGNTNAGEIKHAIVLLNRALADYKMYTRAAASLARARGVPVPYR